MGILFLTLELFRTPSSFSKILTRPGFPQSFGCILPGSKTTSNPSPATASTISLASGFSTANAFPTRRPSALVLVESKYTGYRHCQCLWRSVSAEVGARNWGCRVWWGWGAWRVPGGGMLAGRMMEEANSEGSISEGSESGSESETSSMRAC